MIFSTCLKEIEINRRGEGKIEMTGREKRVREGEEQMREGKDRGKEQKMEQSEKLL